MSERRHTHASGAGPEFRLLDKAVLATPGSVAGLLTAASTVPVGLSTLSQVLRPRHRLSHIGDGCEV